MESTARRLLVATPTLLDPNFSRTVVFMVEHNDDGALGVVLNRPTDVPVADPLPEWSTVATDPGVAFLGGPVQPQDAVIGLARVAAPEECDGWQALVGTLGTVDLGRSPDEIPVALESVRVFAGYAGWGPRQLDVELTRNDWFVVDAHPDDMFTSDPAALWRDVLRRQRGDLAMVANFPLDPSVN
jgi:putative transcriptional regulator